MARLPSRLRRLAIADLASVSAFGCLCAALGMRLADATGVPARPALALLVLPLAWLFADLCSGIVHWVADRYFDEDTPLLGPLLIRAFREHHRDPAAMVEHGFLELSGNNCLICLPPLLGLLALPEPTAAGAFALETACLWVAFAIFATNHIHRWAHAPQIPAVVGVLQRLGLVLSPASHSRHHRRHDAAYCVTNGWMNPLLDRSGFFAALERRLPASERGPSR